MIFSMGWTKLHSSSRWIAPRAWIAIPVEVADETIAADLTVTMAAVKQGLLKLPAFEYVGDLEVVDIGLPMICLPSRI